MVFSRKARVARISTVPFFVYSQLSTQLKDTFLSGADVYIITSPAKPYEKNIVFDSTHKLIEVEIPRKIEVLNDLKALMSLYIIFRSRKFNIIHSTTPKAGLLSSVAGLFARVPVRIHTFTGQTWVEKKGLKRKFFKFLDWMIVKLNHHCYADSDSQMKFLISEGICSESDISVLGFGSLAGVNLDRFSEDNFSKKSKRNLRESLSIREESIVITFVGRIAKDKGIVELLTAFKILLSNGIDVSLLLVGPIDEDVMIDAITLNSYISNAEGIKSIGFTSTPEIYLSISDVFCLPSYREGFGTVIIESAAMGIPSVASNIYGLSDAVQDGETGILVEVKSVDSLVNALTLLATDHKLRESMGQSAKNRAVSYFGSKKVNSLVINEYTRLMDN